MAVYLSTSLVVARAGWNPCALYDAHCHRASTPVNRLRVDFPNNPGGRISSRSLGPGAEAGWRRAFKVASTATGGGGGDWSGSGIGSGGGGGGEENENDNDKNREEAMLALSALGKSLETIPGDLAVAVTEGRVPGAIINRYAELEKSALFRWFFQFGGFKERLLADDLFLAKVAMECGFGIFVKVFIISTVKILHFYFNIYIFYSEIQVEFISR